MVSIEKVIETLGHAKEDLQVCYNPEAARSELEALTAQFTQQHKVVLASKQYGLVEQKLVEYEDLFERTNAALEFNELVAQEGDVHARESAISESRMLLLDIGKFVLEQKLDGPYDSLGAVITGQVGSGRDFIQGLMSQLLDAYTSFGQQHGWTVCAVDRESPTDQTISVAGENAYGFLRAEHGSHRMEYRNKASMVHTGYLTIIVEPLIITEKQIIAESDLDIEYIASSSKGGQHANRSHTSVRITHRPTGIAAKSCTRSQAGSYRNALEVLQSRVERQRIELSAGAERVAPGKASHFRSYDFTQTPRIQDMRSKVELGGKQAEKFFAGNIAPFIYAAHGLNGKYVLPE